MYERSEMKNQYLAVFETTIIHTAKPKWPQIRTQYPFHDIIKGKVDIIKGIVMALYTKQEWKSSLLGALEIGLFMKQGPQRFSNDFKTMLKSWWVLTLTLALTAISLFYMAPENPSLSTLSMGTVLGLFAFKSIFVTLSCFGFIYFIASFCDRKEYFFQCITASNWASLAPTILFILPFITVVMGYHTWADIEPVMVIFAIYTYVMAAYILTRTLNIPWEMGGFAAIFTMAIGQTSLDLLYLVAETL